MMNPQADVLSRSRATLLLLAALFFAPFLAAWLIYRFAPEWRPRGTTAYGQLIAPALPVPALALRDASGEASPESLRAKWSLVYLGAAECDANCVDRNKLVRQIRLALGKDLSRLQRVYVAPDAVSRDAAVALLAKDHPGLRIVDDAGVAGARAADFFKSADPQAFYLVDPNGNWLMIYAGPIDPKLLLGDLKKLLRLSSIG